MRQELLCAYCDSRVWCSVRDDESRRQSDVRCSALSCLSLSLRALKGIVLALAARGQEPKG